MLRSVKFGSTQFACRRESGSDALSRWDTEAFGAGDRHGGPRRQREQRLGRRRAGCGRARVRPVSPSARSAVRGHAGSRTGATPTGGALRAEADGAAMHAPSGQLGRADVRRSAGTTLAKRRACSTAAGSGATYTRHRAHGQRPLGPLANGEQTFPVSATAAGGELKFSLKCARAPARALRSRRQDRPQRRRRQQADARGRRRPQPGLGLQPDDRAYDLPMMLDVRAQRRRLRAQARRHPRSTAPWSTTGKPFGDDACPAEDLSAGSAQVDLALDAQCVTSTTCRSRSNDHRTSQTARTRSRCASPTAAGNVGVLDARRAVVEVLNNPYLGSARRRSSDIGSSGVDSPQPNPSPGPGGAVDRAQLAACRTPRLSVSLRSKPLRVSKNRPVLLAKKRYRFEGRLTCVVNGKRRSAPKSTRIEVLNKVGRKTVSKPATRLARRPASSTWCSRPRTCRAAAR